MFIISTLTSCSNCKAHNCFWDVAWHLFVKGVRSIVNKLYSRYRSSSIIWCHPPRFSPNFAPSPLCSDWRVFECFTFTFCIVCFILSFRQYTNIFTFIVDNGVWNYIKEFNWFFSKHASKLNKRLTEYMFLDFFPFMVSKNVSHWKVQLILFIEYIKTKQN